MNLALWQVQPPTDGSMCSSDVSAKYWNLSQSTELLYTKAVGRNTEWKNGPTICLPIHLPTHPSVHFIILYFWKEKQEESRKVRTFGLDPVGYIATQFTPHSTGVLHRGWLAFSFLTYQGYGIYTKRHNHSKLQLSSLLRVRQAVSFKRHFSQSFPSELQSNIWYKYEWLKEEAEQFLTFTYISLRQEWKIDLNQHSKFWSSGSGFVNKKDPEVTSQLSKLPGLGAGRGREGDLRSLPLS